MRAEDRADPSDNSGDVVIFKEQNHTARRRLDGFAIDSDNPRFVPRPKESASNGDLRVLTPDGDMQPFIKVGLLGGFDLLDSDSASGGDGTHVDAIDLLAAGVLQETGKN